MKKATPKAKTLKARLEDLEVKVRVRDEFFAELKVHQAVLDGHVKFIFELLSDIENKIKGISAGGHNAVFVEDVCKDFDKIENRLTTVEYGLKFAVMQFKPEGEVAK